jgi:thiamine pyrophosphokinase
MKNYTIFANGEIKNYDLKLPSNQIIIAADGGARHCTHLGIIPQLIIGDFDSLTSEEITFFEQNGVQLKWFSTEKDETDLELALDHVLVQNAKQVTLYGIFGGRWDMCLANIFLLASQKYDSISFTVIERNSTAYIIRAGKTLNFAGKPGTIVSIMPIMGPANGVSCHGLKWNMNNDSLSFGTPRGVSNLMVDSNAQISVNEGMLLVFVNNIGDNQSVIV